MNSPSDARPTGIPAAPEAAPHPGAAPSTPAPAHAAAAAEYARLLAIMARLRRPGDGCPWDLEQTLDSLKPYLIEEAYEALDALETHNRDDLVEELGDLLLQIVFIAQVGSETALFDMADVARGISDKLIRRHPHIFGTESAPTTADVLRNWDKIKRDEKKTRTSALDGIPSHVPPLHRAYQLQKRAARAGFDWADVDGAMAKLREEVGELGEAIAEDSRAHMMEELGDVLFAAVKVARFLQCDPHYALSKTNDKFERRFRAMESEILAEGKTLKDCTLPEMEAHWNRHRAADKTHG